MGLYPCLPVCVCHKSVSYRTMEATRSRHGWVHVFITHRPTVTLQLHNFDLFRTCRTSSFCTVEWQLARFQLTRRIAIAELLVRAAVAKKRPPLWRYKRLSVEYTIAATLHVSSALCVHTSLCATHSFFTDIFVLLQTNLFFGDDVMSAVVPSLWSINRLMCNACGTDRWISTAVHQSRLGACACRCRQLLCITTAKRYVANSLHTII